MKLSEFEASELKAGRLVTVTMPVTPAPAMLKEPYQFKAGPTWYSGAGLMSSVHKCPFGSEGDELSINGMGVTVVKIWCDLKIGNKPLDWKNNPWHFYAQLKAVSSHGG